MRLSLWNPPNVEIKNPRDQKTKKFPACHNATIYLRSLSLPPYLNLSHIWKIKERSLLIREWGKKNHIWWWEFSNHALFQCFMKQQTTHAKREACMSSVSHWNDLHYFTVSHYVGGTHTCLLALRCGFFSGGRELTSRAIVGGFVKSFYWSS